MSVIKYGWVVDRRLFLKLGLGALGCAAFPFPRLFSSLFAHSNSALVLSKESETLASERLLFLSPSDHRLLTAVADRLLPGTADGALPKASEIQTIDRMDKIIALRLDARSQRDFRTLLWLFNLLALGQFESFPPHRQDTYLREWEESAFPINREIFRALKKLVTAAYFSTDSVWSSMGYPGPYPAVPFAQREPTDRAIGRTVPPEPMERNVPSHCRS